jgi:RNA polymerase sigma-70 factor (ECF subfamily)
MNVVMNRDSDREPKDSELISRAKEGEMEAFGALYERYIDLIFRYLRTRVSEKQTAEDLAEVVFLKAFQSLDRYQERGWPFSSYLYQVARNQLADHYRRQRDEVPLEEAQELEAPTYGLDRAAILDEQIQALQDALEKLPEDYQEIIRLRLLLELPTSDVAAMLNRSEGAIRVLLHRALKALRKQIKQC